MSDRPVIPLKVKSGKPSPEVLAQLDRHWRSRYLMLAPHRLGFFLAMVLLVASGAWWALVQVSRISDGALSLHFGLSPSLLHAAVMVFGFIPLFFSGFLFTAGPKWLGVEPWETSALRPALVLQAAGWLVWLAGGHIDSVLAMLGSCVAWVGLAWMASLFWRLVLCSQAPDQVHARAIGVAMGVGVLSLLGMCLSLVFEAQDIARVFVLTALWGFVLVVYATVAHRMIPFFTSSAMPGIAARRPFWVLALMVGAAWGEAGAVLAGAWWPPSAPALLLRGMLELGVGAVLLWLAGVWWRVLGLRNRLLAMLHAGFVWLGLAWVLGGAAHAWHGWQGTAVWPLAMLHALALGCMGALMLAMVSRVSCGHGGRPLVADGLLWSLFWLLQGAVLLRLAAALWPAWGAALLPWAALLWAVVVLAWGLRMGRWYGRPRADGRPG